MYQYPHVVAVTFYTYARVIHDHARPPPPMDLSDLRKREASVLLAILQEKVG